MKEFCLSPVGWLVIYLLLMNLAAFLVYGVDKRRAGREQWRIPEKTLLLLPILGGSLGALLGMRVFRHKTLHWYFRFGIPAILVVQIALPIVLALWLRK